MCFENFYNLTCVSPVGKKYSDVSICKSLINFVYNILLVYGRKSRKHIHKEKNNMEFLLSKFLILCDII